ncbi:MAG: hypothetical protein AAFN68_06190, partial [Pseudomonadota bacterium]
PAPAMGTQHEHLAYSCASPSWLLPQCKSAFLHFCVAAIEKQLCSNCFYPAIKSPRYYSITRAFCLLVDN